MNLFDLLFPPYCISCQKITDNKSVFYKYLCSDCLRKIKINEDDVCISCHNLTRFGKTCSSCSKSTSLSGLLVASDYKNPILKETIHYFKYNNVKDLSLPLSWVFLKKLEEFEWKNKEEWVFIPVPLAKKRLKFRGFNQAELLAQNLAKWLNISISSAIIERVRFRTPQMQIENNQERLENIKNSFRIVKNLDLSEIRNKRIMLIDDVSTTGATLSECAKVLKPYVKEVWGCVLAK